MKALIAISIVAGALLYFVLNQPLFISISIPCGFVFGIYVLIRNALNTHIQEAQKSVGEQYEIIVGKEYEDMGYAIEYRGIDLGKLDGGIDLIATKEEQTLLIQCKYWYKKDSINHKILKEFFGNCNIYMNQENFNQGARENTICVFVIPSDVVLDYSAKATCKDNYKCLRYKIIKANIKI